MAPVESPPRPVETSPGEQALDLRDGRELRVTAEGPEDVVEIRAPGGRLELRLRLTDDGVVLDVESVRLALRATESVDVDCRDFTLRAGGEARIAAGGEVRVTGETIHLN